METTKPVLSYGWEMSAVGENLLMSPYAPYLIAAALAVFAALFAVRRRMKNTNDGKAESASAPEADAPPWHDAVRGGLALVVTALCAYVAVTRPQSRVFAVFFAIAGMAYAAFYAVHAVARRKRGERNE